MAPLHLTTPVSTTLQLSPLRALSQSHTGSHWQSQDGQCQLLSSWKPVNLVHVVRLPLMIIIVGFGAKTQRCSRVLRSELQAVFGPP